ncbi:MAG: Trp family transcriptional regulator [Patescibacteria group bacterium]
MMQTSNQSLDKQVQRKLEDQFFTLLADLTHPKDQEKFLRDFLTDTELSVFSKRLAVIKMLNEEKSYADIKGAIQVSSATISGLAETKHKPGLKLAISKMKFDNWVEKFLNRIILR